MKLNGLFMQYHRLLETTMRLTAFVLCLVFDLAFVTFPCYLFCSLLCNVFSWSDLALSNYIFKLGVSPVWRQVTAALKQCDPFETKCSKFFWLVRVVARSSNSLSLEVYDRKSPHHHCWTPIKHILWGVLVLIKKNRVEEVWTQFTSREMISPFSTSIFIFCVMSSWRQILTWYQDIILLNIKHFYPTCVCLEHRFVGFRKRWCLAWTPIAHSTRGDGWNSG